MHCTWQYEILLCETYYLIMSIMWENNILLHPTSAMGVTVLASSVCLCLSVHLTFLAKQRHIQTWILVCRSWLKISRLRFKVKVIGQRSRSPSPKMSPDSMPLGTSPKDMASLAVVPRHQLPAVITSWLGLWLWIWLVLTCRGVFSACVFFSMT